MGREDMAFKLSLPTFLWRTHKNMQRVVHLPSTHTAHTWPAWKAQNADIACDAESMFRSFYVEACVLSSHQHAYIVSNAQMYRVHDERFCADTKGIGSVVHIII